MRLDHQDVPTIIDFSVFLLSSLVYQDEMKRTTKRNKKKPKNKTFIFNKSTNRLKAFVPAQAKGKFDECSTSSQCNSPLVAQVDNINDEEFPFLSDNQEYPASWESSPYMDDEIEEDEDDVAQVSDAEFTTHQLRMRRQRLAWEGIRYNLVVAGAENLSGPSTKTICFGCGQSGLSCNFKCLDCSPTGHLCVTCVQEMHRTSRIDHRLFYYNDFFHVPVENEGFVTSNGECSHSNKCPLKKKQITCVDANGFQHKTVFQYSECINEAVAIMQCGYWPGSPHSPQVMFSLDFMETLYVMYFECQVSIRKFCDAMEFKKKPWMTNYIVDIYRTLNSCFNEYCVWRRRSKYLSEVYLPINVDDGSSCPACAESEGVLSMCYDGCFGLVRKLRGQSADIDDSLAENTFFVKQNVVDQFVSDHNVATKTGKKSSLKDCNNFRAGEVESALRSKGRNQKLDEKAVLGSVCRHDYPQKFFSCKEGEKIGYAVFLLKQFVSACKESKRKGIFVYDIACTLNSHLGRCGMDSLLLENEGESEERNESDDKEREEEEKEDEEVEVEEKKKKKIVTLALPAFHVYGHIVSCQIKYSPRRLEGFGLTDGEGAERLWSFMTEFSRITKEMTPFNRTACLDNAVLHFAERKRINLGVALLHRLEKAKMSLESAEYELTKLRLQFAAPVKTIKEWIEMERARFEVEQKKVKPSWQQKYMRMLIDFNLLEAAVSALTSADITDRKKLSEGVEKLNSSLVDIEAFEAKNFVQTRWLPSSNVYQDTLKHLVKKEEESLVEQCRSMAYERRLLLGLKKNLSSGGQSIDAKLSSQVSAITTKLKARIAAFKVTMVSFGIRDYGLNLKDVLDTSSGFYCDDQEGELLDGSRDGIPISIKRTIMHCFHLKNRASEELVLIDQEFSSAKVFYDAEIKKVDDILLNYPLLSNSLHALLYQAKYQYRYLLQELYKTIPGCKEECFCLSTIRFRDITSPIIADSNSDME